MKKVIAINGSPRRNGNTAELFQQALKGAQEAGAETKTLYAYNTTQFSDYAKYESSIFDPQAKAAYREEMFPKQCAAAYELGKSLLGS